MNVHTEFTDIKKMGLKWQIELHFLKIVTNYDK